MGNFFICDKCGNSDPLYIGFLNGKPYCRRCIDFIGKEPDDFYIPSKENNLKIDYKLTEEQERISNELLNNYKNGFNQLVKAVCGAGKTELVFKVIEYVMKNNLKVAFSVPRRDVIIDLESRFKEAFPNSKIVTIYGGHTEDLEGDLILLTTHQLYRFKNYFDLLIIDEIDAFPYNGDPVLYNFAKNSIRGNFIYLSATPDKKIVNEFKNNKNCKLLNLDVRYHMHPIPEPQIIIKRFFIFRLIYLIKKLRFYINENKPCLVFVPTIDDTKKVFNFIKNLAKPGYFVNSKSKNRSKIIEDFRLGKYKYLITTAVLERGVTIKDLQVIVFNSNHKIYNEASLVQISGRVGRKIDSYEGEVIFLGEKKTKYMEEAISNIQNSNKILQNLLQRNKKEQLP